MPSQSSDVYERSWSSIHGPPMTSTATVARIFGMKVSVCSWICVTAWKTEMTRPTASAMPSSGRAIFRPSSSAPVVSGMTTSSFSRSSGPATG